MVTSIRDEGGRHLGFSKVTRDLTARREAEQTARELLLAEAARTSAEKLAAQAAESNRLKDEFLATVSHELRTPLNAIVGWSHLLLQRGLAPEVARGIEVIDRNAAAQARLVEDILDVSRIVAGKLRIEPRPMDLVVTVKDAIEAVTHAAQARGVRICLESDETSLPLTGDPERLRQVAWNLLSNAVKFSHRDGEVVVRMERNAAGVRLVVRDAGRGIHPDFLPAVFDRFTQEESSTTRRVGGLGLGLALVRHIVELHGGSVAVESKLSEGATFSVSLPA